jgi:hypothetical protein
MKPPPDRGHPDSLAPVGSIGQRWKEQEGSAWHDLEGEEGGTQRDLWREQEDALGIWTRRPVGGSMGSARRDLEGEVGGARHHLWRQEDGPIWRAQEGSAGQDGPSAGAGGRGGEEQPSKG